MPDDLQAMKNAILAYVKANPYASFVNLERAIAGFKGDAGFGPRPNLYYWTGLSERAIDAIGELVREKKLHYEVASRISYQVDGQLLSLPVARKNRPYVKPHWLPVVLCEGPPQLGAGKPKRR